MKNALYYGDNLAVVLGNFGALSKGRYHEY
jgi:hypothetical protein